MLAPINSIKHYVQHTDAVIASGAVVTDRLVDAVVAPAASAPNQVTEGSVIKAVYIERWILGEGAAAVPSQFTLIVEKTSGGQGDMTFTESQNLSSYDNKKNILYTTQGIVGEASVGASTVPILRTWVLIPKGKQRFGLGDRLICTIGFVTSGRRCGIETYKEYR